MAQDTNWIAALASGAACIALAACSPSAPQETAPPPPPPAQAPPPALAGPPPAPIAEQDAGPVVVTMAPIPNPENLSAEDRRRIYGPGDRETAYAEHRAHRVYNVGPAYRVGPVYQVGADHRLVPLHPAHAVAPVVAPIHAAPKPVAPVAAIKPAAAPAVTKPPTKLAQLQASVGQAVSKGASLSVSPDVAQGKAGGVSLSLPASLPELLREQAAKLGLRRAARDADVSATLSGPGYLVAPAAKQTQPLKAGQPVKFSWQVTPGLGASGPLSAQVEAALKGQGAPKVLSLATMQTAVARAAGQAEQAASGLHLPSLSHLLDKLFGHKEAANPAAASPQAASQSPLHDRTLPVIGRISARAQIAAFLTFLAILILLLIQRSMSDQRRAADRRRYRSKPEPYRPVDLDAEPPATA